EHVMTAYGVDTVPAGAPLEVGDRDWLVPPRGEQQPLGISSQHLLKTDLRVLLYEVLCDRLSTRGVDDVSDEGVTADGDDRIRPNHQEDARARQATKAGDDRIAPGAQLVDQSVGLPRSIQRASDLAYRFEDAVQPLGIDHEDRDTETVQFVDCVLVIHFSCGDHHVRTQ